jgi:hypothetical protein
MARTHARTHTHMHTHAHAHTGPGEETALGLSVPLVEPGRHVLRLRFYPTWSGPARPGTPRAVELPAAYCSVDAAHAAAPRRDHRRWLPAPAPPHDPAPATGLLEGAADGRLGGTVPSPWRCGVEVRRRVCAALLDLLVRARAGPGQGAEAGEAWERAMEAPLAGHGPVHRLLEEAAARRAELGLVADAEEGSAAAAAAGEVGAGGPAGLDNLGNSCYQNALLQVA